MSTAEAKREAPKTGAKPSGKPQEMTGAEIVLKALIDQGVDTIFGYPGGAVLPIYDEIFKNQNNIRHVLGRRVRRFERTHALQCRCRGGRVQGGNP